EGSIDTQTLQGKGPYGVALRAKEKNIPVIGIAGKVPLKPDTELQKYFDVLLSINTKFIDMATALANTETNLIAAAQAVGDSIISNTMQIISKNR
ncbi:MAG TPA: glycerate kinase, partial [Mucilaginibacter sp.]|nr:glycerate kinase [Mucilaginibacter sp.]